MPVVHPWECCCVVLQSAARCWMAEVHGTTPRGGKWFTFLGAPWRLAVDPHPCPDHVSSQGYPPLGVVPCELCHQLSMLDGRGAWHHSQGWCMEADRQGLVSAPSCCLARPGSCLVTQWLCLLLLHTVGCWLWSGQSSVHTPTGALHADVWLVHILLPTVCMAQGGQNLSSTSVLLHSCNLQLLVGRRPLFIQPGVMQSLWGQYVWSTW
jgi:hypothetical protein